MQDATFKKVSGQNVTGQNLAGQNASGQVSTGQNHLSKLAHPRLSLSWNHLTKCLASLVLLISLLIPISVSAQEIKFIRYKNYLIPIEVGPEFAPPMPTGFSGVANSSNSVSLSWNSSAGAHYYVLDWYNDALQGWQTSFSGWQTNYTAEGMLLGPNKFRVMACRNTLCSSPTSTFIVTVSSNGSVTYSTEPSEFDDPDDPIETQTGITYAGVCLAPGVTLENCDPDDIDSDGDGDADVSDSYPFQHNTQCLP